MTLNKPIIHLLVVDDEQGMRDMLSWELGSQGYQITTARNGEEAVKSMRKQKFDLVITDFKMPKMDGLDLLKNIKGIDAELIVIMATGHGTMDTAMKATKNGVYEFILKPYDLDHLSALIEQALLKKK